MATVAVRACVSVAAASEYSAWAKTVASSDSTYDGEGLLSASHSIVAVLSTLADGECYNSAWKGYSLSLERITFIESSRILDRRTRRIMLSSTS